MLRISKLTDYGTVVMAELARDPVRIVSTSHLAEKLTLGQPTLSKILKRLAAAGLVQSYRGADGGYQLQGAPENISVAAIIDALEGPISLTECSTDEHACSQESQCGVRDHWQVINHAVRQSLESVSLASMVRPTTVAPLARISLSQLGSTKNPGGATFSQSAMNTNLR